MLASAQGNRSTRDCCSVLLAVPRNLLALLRSAIFGLGQLVRSGLYEGWQFARTLPPIARQALALTKHLQYPTPRFVARRTLAVSTGSCVALPAVGTQLFYMLEARCARQLA